MGGGIVIAGTGTDVGKTVITAGLLNWLTGEGLACAPMKPVQTGCREKYPEECRGERKPHRPAAEALIAPDLDFCLAAAGLTPGPEDLQLMAPYRYRPACSPHLAGRLSGRYVQIEPILRCYRQLAVRYDVVLIEGAGGIMVPLNESETFLDLIKRLNLPVIVVGLAGLGTINHTLLTLQALRAGHVEVIGCILNHTRPPESAATCIYQDNPGIIARFGRTAVLGNIGYMQPLTAPNAAVWEQFYDDLPGKEIIKERIKHFVSR